mmetsp:Transcript_82061/g.154772  ORF Transcript_82061/g.154772 Transcript_82061/m.154772 type:complete len:210 (-) Transcript_82061:447-1076(-)
MSCSSTGRRFSSFGPSARSSSVSNSSVPSLGTAGSCHGKSTTWPPSKIFCELRGSPQGYEYPDQSESHLLDSASAADCLSLGESWGLWPGLKSASSSSASSSASGSASDSTNVVSTEISRSSIDASLQGSSASPNFCDGCSGDATSLQADDAVAGSTQGSEQLDSRSLNGHASGGAASVNFSAACSTSSPRIAPALHFVADGFNGGSGW